MAGFTSRWPRILQRVGHAAGHHAAVGQRQRVGPELGQGGILEQEGGSGALYGHHKELQQAEADTVHLRGKWSTVMIES